MKILLLIFAIFFHTFSCKAQEADMHKKATIFLNSLGSMQQIQAQFPFDTSERYTWHYIPKDDRKGISLNELNEQQKKAAIQLMKTALSEKGYEKASAIMQLEKVLKVLENRQESDRYRDTGKYFFTVFGVPSESGIWGWRLDGHHLSFNFSSQANRLVSGTPGFMGANPAVVLSGPEKGMEILKEENELALELLHALSNDQLTKTVFNNTAPGDIVTGNSRKALIENRTGISYNMLTTSQKEIFIKLLSIYLHRYTHLFAEKMMRDIELAGMENLLFAWAGSQQNGPGNKRYYRIQGPTIIIEYDNTQNNGNHVHTVIRDLKNDFGGDELLEHYKKSH